MDRIDFSGGASIQPTDTGKRGVYQFKGKSIPVTIQGIDQYGGVTFSRADNVQFYQSGTRAVRLTPLTAPTISPLTIPPRPSAPGNPPSAQPGVGWRSGNMNRGQRPAVAQEFRLGSGAGWVREASPTPPAPQSNVVQWIARGSNTLPALPGFGASGAKTLIDTVVPRGYRLRLSQYCLTLGPSDFWEDNLIWRLKIGDTDVLNPFGNVQALRSLYIALGGAIAAQNTFWTGRPTRSGVLTPFSFLKDDLVVVPPETRILLTVEAVAAWAGDTPTDTIGAAIFGTLWGDK